MDTDLLVEKIKFGAALIRQLIRDQFEVTVAFWVKRTEEGLWHLYVSTASVSAEKLNDAYRIVYATLTKIPDCSILPSEIKVITATDPIARDAVVLRDRGPTDRNENGDLDRYHGKRLGNLATHEIRIYPRRLPLEVRELPNGPWQVLISEFDDVWLTCDSEDDARTIAKARVLEEVALGQMKSGESFAEELDKTAAVMERYRMGFGTRFLGRLAQEVRRRAQEVRQ